MIDALLCPSWRACGFHVSAVFQSRALPWSDGDSNASRPFAIPHVRLDTDAHTLAPANYTAVTMSPSSNQERVGGEMQTCCGSTCQDYRNDCGDGTASRHGSRRLGALRVAEDHLLVAGARRGGGGGGAKSLSESPVRPVYLSGVPRNFPSSTGGAASRACASRTRRALDFIRGAAASGSKGPRR